MNIDTPYYEDHERVSNSSIGWFLKKGPSYFYKMLKGEIEGEKTSSMEKGTMIHSFILTPEEFQKDYVVWNKSRPTSTQQEAFCQALASSTEIEPNRAILDAYKQAYSTRGKSDDLMLSEGLKIASTLKDYIDFLKANDGRTMISPWDVKMLEKIKQNVQSHKLAKYIINNAEECINHHEFHINWSWCGSIKCKSLLDGLRIDVQQKIITIYDLKTTAKLWHFEESISMYDYCRQLCYYTMAVEWYLINEMHEHPEDWRFKYYIVGIDTTGSNEIRVFKVELSAVESRREVIRSALKEIIWHQANNLWDHSRAYYEGDGSESLNI